MKHVFHVLVGKCDVLCISLLVQCSAQMSLKLCDAGEKTSTVSFHKEPLTSIGANNAMLCGFKVLITNLC